MTTPSKAGAILAAVNENVAPVDESQRRTGAAEVTLSGSSISILIDDPDLLDGLLVAADAESVDDFQYLNKTLEFKVIVPSGGKPGGTILLTSTTRLDK